MSISPSETDFIEEPAETLEDNEFFDANQERQIPLDTAKSDVEWVENPLPLQSDYPWCPAPWRKPLGFVWWVFRTAFSLLSLIVILAVIAAIPIVNFIALGYLLEVEARVARSGKLTAAFPLLNQASRVGVIIAGIWIALIPLRLLSSYAADAQLIDPQSPTTVGVTLAVRVAWVLTTGYILAALAGGGSVFCFLWPFKNLSWAFREILAGRYLDTAGQNVREFLQMLQIRGLFWQGLRGFGVALLWLFIPTVFYAAVRKPEGLPILLMIFGGFLLTMTLMWVPFLQARFAATGVFRAGLQLSEIRSLWRYAPISWTFATVFLYLLALPLYLFKAFALPQDALWLMTLVFVATIFPTRIITGWAYGRAVRRRALGLRTHWTIRYLCSLVLWPLMGIFVFILFFTQFLGAEGRLVLFAHHALLLPAPFFLSGG